MQTLIFFTLLITTVIQLYIWICNLDILSRRSHENKEQDHEQSPTVTVILPVKNELANLQKNLSSILAQDYENHKYIIVDDHSEDDTTTFLKSIQSSRLQVERLPSGHHGKKAALSYGITIADSEWIITTDADCTPHSDQWISSLMSSNKTSDVIIGYSPYRKHDSALSNLVAYESWYIALQYFTAALRGRPYMAVGRNLAFKKSVFQAVGGYDSHLNIKSGDDDLFISSLGNSYSYGISTNINSWMWTEPARYWNEYIRQKRRHLSTSPRYTLSDKIRLSAAYISQLLWYVSIIICSLINWKLAFSIFILRSIILILVAKRSERQLGNQFSVFLVPLWDFILCLFYLLMSATFFKPLKQW